MADTPSVRHGTIDAEDRHSTYDWDDPPVLDGTLVPHKHCDEHLLRGEAVIWVGRSSHVRHSSAENTTAGSTVPVVGGAAFFDLDNTLIKGSALFHVGRGMVRHGVITRREIARHFLKQAGFRWRGERSRELVGVRERALALGAGLKVAELVALGEQVYDEALAGRIWEGSRQLAHRHLEGGEPVWLVTAAPVELADIAARRLGLTGALGTVAEVKDGAWTGRLVGEVLHGSAKAVAVRALAERHSLDLGQSAAYSDSINDLPLLRAAAHPHAVNPDRELRRLAREEGWPIHDFRSGRRLVRVAAPVAVAATAAGALALWRAGPRCERKGITYEGRRAAWALKKAGVGRRA